MTEFEFQYGLYQAMSLKWDFVKLRWWSRIYEYKWVIDCINNSFNKADRMKMRVLDAGCGNMHPLPFILSSLGFGHVIAQDIISEHLLIKTVMYHDNKKKLDYMCADMSIPYQMTYDIIICLSVLEHINPQYQEQVLENMANAVIPGGILIMTFDMPGYEFETNLDLYKQCLRKLGFRFKETLAKSIHTLTSKNGKVVMPNFDEVHRDELYVYRLFCQKE